MLQASPLQGGTMTETTKTIDILLLGSGGREHALAKKLGE